MANELKPSQAAGQPLYQIAAEYGDLLDHLMEVAEQNDGVLPDALADEFESLSGELMEKIQNCGMVIKVLAQQVDTIKAEKQRLSDLQRTVENSKDRLKEYTSANMVKLDIKRSDGDLLKVRTQYNPPKCHVVDADEVPDEFAVISLEMSADDWGKVSSLLTDFELETDDWGPVRSISTKPIIDRWKKWKKAEEAKTEDDEPSEFDVPGVKITQNIGLRVW